MDYMISNVIIVNAIILPVLFLLWWQMGWKNWPKIIFTIISYPLMDIDHFILTNVPGFGAEAEPGQKILHVTHTIEFLVIVIILSLIYFTLIDPKKGRDFKAWIFPIKEDYSKLRNYYIAWTVRILLFGMAIHWLIDLVIYSVHLKWNHLYLSIIDYLINPT